MIKQYSLQALESVINKALSLDEEMPIKLLKLDGKIIKIIIISLPVHFFITFTQGKIVLMANAAREPDAVIESSPFGLIKLSLLPVSKTRALFHDEVKLSGDIELGQQIKKIFDELDIDWEGRLAYFTGDIVAFQIGSLIRRGHALSNKLTISLCHNVTEYLQEEKRYFPSQEEINDFCDDVDKLTDDTERLAAQILALGTTT